MQKHTAARVSKQRAGRLMNPGSILAKAEHYVLFAVSSIGILQKWFCGFFP